MTTKNMDKALIILTLLILSATSKTCMETFSARSIPRGYLGGPSCGLPIIRDNMKSWLDERSTVEIIGSGLSESDDIYVGYFLYVC